MQNRWSDSEAAGFVAAQGTSCENSLALLTYATRLLGSEPDLAMHGGGNTSCKTTLTGVLGEAQPALFIKASGVDLATIAPGDFVALDHRYLVRLLDLGSLSDEAMAGEFACHGLRPSPRRASVETLVHAVLGPTYVMHTHPGVILGLTNRAAGAEAIAAALGKDIAVVPYARAGLELAQAVRTTMRQSTKAGALVLMHHGLVTWGATAREAYDATIALVSRAESWLTKSRTQTLAANAPATAERERRYLRLAPVIRSALGGGQANNLGERVILEALLDPDLANLLEAPGGKKLALTAPLTPDYLVRTRRFPLWLDGAGNVESAEDVKAFRQRLEPAIAAYQAEYRSYVQQQTGPVADSPDFLPRVILIPGVGVVCAGRNVAEARMVRDITRQGLRVKIAIVEGGDDYVPLTDDHLFDMEFRGYQQAKTARTARDDEHDLGSSVTLVTGAAGAIGSGICQALLDRGCHVAATDLPGAALDGLVGELHQHYPGRILAVAMDVTDAASVTAGFAKVIRTWGGLDGVIVNAGIAHVAPLTELTLDAFRKLEAVNVEGTLLVLAEAGRHFAVQASGGDIVLVSTKNVFAPGAGFGAYSATKAAAHQLARIASLEFAPLGVRVNMVAPDAVFSHGEKRSGLWAAVGPNRMKARGLDERGLEEYYRSRNLLKAPVTAEHVAAAVIFFLSHQTPTTGATIPVDGGLPDATPR
jgi:rhamnose utilization protein RhaD (predicted bifunctional aldolase and dehydrogenase)/NAD(P)-dependent dehydrogenase (short-subunit alcohol dehydrogenase family)